MANEEHRTMVSADVHEPKHITDTTAADAGKVITPLSGGTSELRNLTPEEVGVRFAYSEAGIAENTTAIVMTAATDGDLYTPTDYIKLTSANLPGATVDEAFAMTFDGVNYNFTIPYNGIYKTEFWANIESDANNTKIGFKFTKNGTPASDVVKHDIATTGRVANISSTFLSDLVAGDEIGMAIAADKAANVTITDIKMVVYLIHEV